MDKRQAQSEQQCIKACIARVEGDCNKGAGEKTAPCRLGRLYLLLWQPSMSRLHVQEVLLCKAQALPKASRQNLLVLLISIIVCANAPSCILIGSQL